MDVGDGIWGWIGGWRLDFGLWNLVLDFEFVVGIAGFGFGILGLDVGMMSDMEFGVWIDYDMLEVWIPD